MRPIFIACTRSFWLGIVPSALVLLDLVTQILGDETIGPVAGLVAGVTGMDYHKTESVMRGVAAVATMIVAHQRRGYNRPYTTDPRAVK